MQLLIKIQIGIICDLNIKRWQVFENSISKRINAKWPFLFVCLICVLFLLSFFKSRLGKKITKFLDITCTRIKKATATCIYKLVFKFSHQFRLFVNRSWCRQWSNSVPVFYFTTNTQTRVLFLWCRPRSTFL